MFLFLFLKRHGTVGHLLHAIHDVTILISSPSAGRAILTYLGSHMQLMGFNHFVMSF